MTDVMKPMDNDSNSPSYVQPGAIHPDVGQTPIRGAAPASHPELAADHPEARKLRIAAAEVSGHYTAAPDGSNPETLEASAYGAFVPSAGLSPREHRK